MLGPYEVLSMVGRGGIGTVYRARHRGSGREVAVKLLGPPPACDPAAARRLAREFEALRGLRHPNVVRVYDAGVHEGYSFLAMELVEGLDLRSYLSPLVDEAANGILPQTAPASSGATAGQPSLPHDPAPRRGDRGEASTPSSTPRLPLGLWSDEPETESLLAAPAAGAAGTDALRAFAALMEEPETEPRPEPSPGTPAGPSSRAAPAQPFPAAFTARLNARERLERLRAAMVQVCDGLGYVHERGLVHRDLKPSNIMVDDARQVRLMDFGLVKLAGESTSLTLHGRVVGTYRYMAPEQARGEPVDRRSDLYSLGVVLFELLCGRPPFLARVAPELWNAIVSVPAPPVLSVNPGAPPRLAAIAERLLAKDPRERYQRAEEVGAELRRA